jgi:ATP-dependent Lhr-like helicase
MPGFLGTRPAWPDRLNLTVVNTIEPDLFSSSLLPEIFLRWFASRGWSPREHQLALLDKARDGRSALLIAPTGAGKTLAGFLPTLVELSSFSPPTTAHGAWWGGVGGGGWLRRLCCTY